MSLLSKKARVLVLAVVVPSLVVLLSSSGSLIWVASKKSKDLHWQRERRG
jgi:hypothetical protein